MAKAKPRRAAKAANPRRRAAGSTKGSDSPAADPLLDKTLTAVKDHARLAGVSPVQYIRGVMTGRFPRLSPRELGE